MDEKSALSAIQSTFVDPQRSNELRNCLTSAKFVEHLDAIEPLLPRLTREVSLFLFCGCLHFSRFAPPTPFVLEPTSFQEFKRFVHHLARNESDVRNVARFLCEQIKWDLYDLLDHELPGKPQQAMMLKAARKQLGKLPRPDSAAKDKEVNDIRTECLALISGFESQALVTRLYTKIPVTPVIDATELSLTWRSRTVRIVLKPKHTGIPNSILSMQEGQPSVASGLSQWQQGYTDVEMEIPGLLAPDTAGQALAVVQDGHGTEFQWPQMFVDVYEILDDVIWKLRSMDQSSGRWLPLPSDIAALRWELWAGGKQIGWMMKDPPGLLLRMRKVASEVKHISLDKETQVPWYSRCRLLAEAHLQAGATNESLFWLNVATEALFEARVDSICSTAGIDVADLSSPRSYWERAEDIVLSQHPYLRGQIEWPESVPGVPSWFTRIRYLGKRVSLRVPVSEILSHYRSIQKHRNALFHGAAEGRLSSSAVSEAFEAFWGLDKNFRADDS